jgi:transcriptional regulator with GAF, ATPase, and Fis domain
MRTPSPPHHASWTVPGPTTKQRGNPLADMGSRLARWQPATKRLVSEVNGTRPCLALEVVKRKQIQSILGKTGRVIDGPKGAATLLGLHPNTLRSRLKKLSIERVCHDCS